jgi:hypothetical protein
MHGYTESREHGMTVRQEDDYFLWLQEQVASLREVARTSNAPVDWDGLIEEIEDLGKSERRTLRSHIGTIIEHLLKLRVSPASDPRKGWQETIFRTQRSLAKLLRESPSLRREVGDIITEEMRDTADLVIDVLRLHDELTPEREAGIRAATVTEAEVLGGRDGRVNSDRPISGKSA